MKKRGLPLSMRILMWCVLNLLLLAALFLALFRGQLGLGLDSLLTGRVGDRLQGIADVLSGELSHTVESEWDEVVTRNSSAYGVRLQVVKLDGRWWAGERLELPPEVLKRIADPRFNDRRFLEDRFGGNPQGNRGFFGPRHRGGGGRGGDGPDGQGRRFNGTPDGLPSGGTQLEDPPLLDGRPPSGRPPGRRSFEEDFAEYLKTGVRPEPPGPRPGQPASAPIEAPAESDFRSGFSGTAAPPEAAPTNPEEVPAGAQPYGPGNPPPPPLAEAGPPPPGARPPFPPPASRPRFLVHAGTPPLYWAGVPLVGLSNEDGRPAPAVLLAVSDSLTAGGWIIDTTPWLLAGFGAVLLSILLWFPLVRGITRSIRSMTKATENIAEGKFDTVAPVHRTDELGRLAHSINHLSGRLGHFVNGQRRFLGDIAHELCSPLARMQLGISLLERGGDPATHERVADVREEVEVMTDLVNELLSFSKAGLRSPDTPLEPVPLAGLARHVAARERGGEEDQDRVQIQIPETLRAMADPGLLSRAVANLVRNALRYAGHAGPVILTGGETADGIFLTVSDSGPGVPDSELEKIFEPFHRPDAARTREAGGSGLGLAIVRSCVQACQGTVSAANKAPTGLAVTIHLAAVPPPVHREERESVRGSPPPSSRHA